ncbi:hypothetical protein QTG54_004227 [Skeletonema marinoi]|uniref:Uncharacterized protein n=1 Tax=Skeletonema marinoi TaxID=267567 RepID=A0AAD8YEB4_9STRA|nr:hypothetical protein QTG54_004227 [Skeletonema marinoi]
MFSSALGKSVAFSGQKDDDANNNEVGQEEVGQEEETEAPAPPKEFQTLGMKLTFRKSLGTYALVCTRAKHSRDQHLLKPASLKRHRSRRKMGWC